MVIIHRTICDQMRDRIAVRLKGGGSLMRHSKNGDLETALSWFPRGVRVRCDLVVIEAAQATSAKILPYSELVLTCTGEAAEMGFRCEWPEGLFDLRSSAIGARRANLRRVDSDVFG